MHILVTGGAGFIGSHLVRWLVEQGEEVRVLDNLSSGKCSFLGPALEHINLIEGDICDMPTLQAAVAKVDLVFHLAARVSVPESIAHPLHAQHTNATGSMQVFETARAAGVRRVVQASSCALYGNNERLPLGESEPPEPLSPYALTKLAAEHAGQLYTSLYGLEVVALRFFNVYGPRQDPSSPYAAVIPRFIERLNAGDQPIIFGDGLQSRDFVFVGDILRALWTAATVPDVAGKVLNVGSGESWSILDLAQMIGDLMQVPVEPQFQPPRCGEVRHSRADVSRFAAAGFRSQVQLREGLATTIAAWQDSQRKLA